MIQNKVQVKIVNLLKKCFYGKFHFYKYLGKLKYDNVLINTLPKCLL